MKILTEETLNDFKNTACELEQLFSSIEEEKINTVPFTGSWTAAQLAEHILKSNSGISKLLKGDIKNTERQPDEKIELIKKLFLDFNSKMIANENVTPSDNFQDKNLLLLSLVQTREEIEEAINTKNLSDICTVFELPGFGEFTRLEWIYFSVYHMKRHIRQLNNIFQKLAINQTQTDKII